MRPVFYALRFDAEEWDKKALRSIPTPGNPAAVFRPISKLIGYFPIWGAVWIGRNLPKELPTFYSDKKEKALRFFNLRTSLVAEAGLEPTTSGL